MAFNQNGAIVSSNTFPTGQGVQITFKTVTYRGNSGGAGKDGADGISFYLMDGSKAAGIGSFGGSLGYSCSNSNPPYDGLVGAYLGLGVDEYGNFLNGTEPHVWLHRQQYGERRQLGIRLWLQAEPHRHAWRGQRHLGVAQSAPIPRTTRRSKLNTAALEQQDAVQKACSTGSLWDYSASAKQPDQGHVAERCSTTRPFRTRTRSCLPTVLIAKEYASGGYKRGDATPIVYNLKITQDGLLSFGYSINGGAYQSVIDEQSISASNGPLPGDVSGSASPARPAAAPNIHEILCFKANPLDLSASSTGVNEKQSAKIESGTQAYFAFYDPNDWTGRLTANDLFINSDGDLAVENTRQLGCVLPADGRAHRQDLSHHRAGGSHRRADPANRVILTWNGSKGVPFRYDNLEHPAEGDNHPGRLADRSTRIASTTCVASARTKSLPRASVCSGRATACWGTSSTRAPPGSARRSLPYTGAWKDRLFPSRNHAGEQRLAELQAVRHGRADPH